MRHFFLDVETYSSVDLKACGAYRYVESPDFMILLCAGAFLDDPVVKQWDINSEEFKEIMFDPEIEKHAHNMMFEMLCFSKHFNLTREQQIKWLDQLKCDMVAGAYFGYPLSLKSLGVALGLGEDKQKLKSGTALINWFSKPDKNGKRRLPENYPEKWQQYVEYNEGDVTTEMEIHKKLSWLKVPELIWDEWRQDCVHQTRGAKHDVEFIKAAIEMKNRVFDKLTEEQKELTGLSNPNSRAQMMEWLENQGVSAPDLTKDTVEKLLDGELPDIARKVLENKKAMGLTSLAKYPKMLEFTAADGRCRNATQFYGAARSGRYSGRGPQYQNYPGTLEEDLEAARQLVLDGNLELIEMMFGNPLDVLSKLLRTAIVASPGKKICSADFSSIESRVAAYLCKQQWTIDEYAGEGRIYEKTASLMFGVPFETIVKGHPNYRFRKLGKVSMLGCSYNGSVGALKRMGSEKMGIPDSELPGLVERWRKANKDIVSAWYEIDDKLRMTVKNKIETEWSGIKFDVVSNGEMSFLRFRYPSGRDSYYAEPRIIINKFGGESVGYLNMNQTTGKWELTDTYGGKGLENVCQSVSRDVLCLGMRRLTEAGYDILFTVHDEVVCEIPEESAEKTVEDIERILGLPVDWAPDLYLKAEGWAGTYYKK